MRPILLAGVALAAIMVGPVAVADATADRAVRDLIENPSICGDANRPADVLAGAPVAEMVMVPGIGSDHMAVDANPEAQAWFDYGVQLRWAFQHTESVRAFQKARLLDPSCGMCAWGEAWAMGPNLNGGGTDDSVDPAALKIARDARRLARDASVQQRRMIDGLIQRYSGRKGSRSDRFARVMDRQARDNPEDITLAALAADAWMINAEDWWNKDGTPKDPGIARAMTILESALARAPDDPGAIHLYIHLTEWSADPHKAIPYGERLAALAPGASHLVHMPSHTFFRVGRYRDAMMSNVEAVALDRQYDGLARPPGGVSGMPLHGHNIHFGMGGALMAGGSEEGLKLADWFLTVFSDIPADNLWRQITANDAYALYGRFGTQAQVEALKEPSAANPLQRVSWRYGRGEAASRRGDAAAYTRAAGLQAEGGSEGGDPPAIWYPTRRSLAAAMLAGGDAAGAKAKVEELLIDWPNDPYSYFVLSRAEAALGNEAAAVEARRHAGAEWIGGGMTLAEA